MCVCARRQPSPTAASPGSPWSPVRVPLCSAASSTCLPPNIVHTALAAALAIPPAAVPACLIAFATHAPRVSCSSDRPREMDAQPTRVDGHPPLTLEHQLTGAPREARKACRGAQLILVTA